MKIRILMIDDHALFREGMRYVLQQLADEVDVLDTGDVETGFQLAAANPDLDLALLDLNMPGSFGISTAASFHQRFPCIPLVVVSGSDERDEIERVMEIGAMGFISKMSASKIMLSALRMVLEGGIYLPPQLLSRREPQEKPDGRLSRPGKHGLTLRQIETLQHLAAGFSNKDIAQKMDISEGTVKVHTAAIYQLLRVKTRTEAVNAAIRLGFIDFAEPPVHDAVQ